mmetsp:Transcript_103964/g.279276  ORF Transcript_103964/g.279276 Transcript_103964/m.279276 type:complete len:201 (+) Transcript_103964:1007-1609(+)
MHSPTGTCSVCRNLWISPASCWRLRSASLSARTSTKNLECRKPAATRRRSSCSLASAMLTSQSLTRMAVCRGGPMWRSCCKFAQVSGFRRRAEASSCIARAASAARWSWLAAWPSIASTSLAPRCWAGSASCGQVPSTRLSRSSFCSLSQGERTCESSRASLLTEIFHHQQRAGPVDARCSDAAGRTACCESSEFGLSLN